MGVVHLQAEEGNPGKVLDSVSTQNFTDAHRDQRETIWLNLSTYFTLLHNFHPLNCCKVLEKEESKNYRPPPGQITPTKTSQMFGLPLFVRKKIELILCITDIAAAVLWPDIFILFLRQLSLQEMKCDFYSLHGNDLYEGRGLSHDNA